jgi:HK97 family phage major capsid protein
MLTTLRHEANKVGRLDVVVEVDTLIEKWSAGNMPSEELDKDIINLESLVKEGKVFERKTRTSMAESVTGFLAPPTSRDPSHYGFWDIFIARSILNRRGQVLPDNWEARFQSLAEKATMTEAGVGTGAELVEEVRSRQLLRDIALATRVMSALPTVTMEAGKMKMSEIGDVTFYKPSSEGVAVTATDLATAERDLIAYELKAQVDVGDTLAEDAVVALIPTIRSVLVQNAAQAIDDCLINADASTGTQNINYYAATGGSSIPTTSRFLLGFDGLIHLALNEASVMTSDLAALTAADFATLLGLMEKYGTNPKSVLFIMDLWAYLKAIQLTEVSTYDKMGAKATISTGELAQIWGCPIIVSQQMLKANATGQVDQTSGNNTKGRIIAVNRDMWRAGLRRIVRVATERSEAKGITSLVCSFRLALQCFGARASVKHTTLGYNVTV